MAELTYEELKAKYLIKPGDGIQMVRPILEGDPIDAYKVLKQNLAIINESRKSYDTPRLQNVNSDVSARKILLDHEDSRNSNNYRSTKPSYLYGVILFWETQPAKSVYVDVPGYSNIEIGHPDEVVNDNYETARLEHLKFYPILTGADAEDVMRGAIAMVEISQFFPNHLVADPEGNKYFGMYKMNGVQPFVQVQNIAESLVNKTSGRTMELGVAGADGQREAVEEGYGVGYEFDVEDPPVGKAKINSGYGMRKHPKYGYLRQHDGVDIAVPCGTPVRVINDCEVSDIRWDPEGYGNWILTKSQNTNGLVIFYAHMQTITAKVGQKLRRGDQIGLSGNTGGSSTGCHLHLGASRFGRGTDPGPIIKKLAGGQMVFLDNQPRVPDVMQFEQGFSREAAVASQPRNRPRMVLTNVQTDLTSSKLLMNDRGANFITVREDISGKIQSIKDTLNFFEIPFSCIRYNIDIKNNNLSYFAKVGLEFSLNHYAGMTINSSLSRDDFYIGPDYKKIFGANYKLKIYGNVRKKIRHEKYNFEEKIIDIYDIKETYLKNKPKIKKIFQTVVDVTQIIEDQGFIQEKPNTEFFVNSNNIASNWYKFYIPLRIEKGSSYRDVLETVYDLEKHKNIDIPELIWDGEKFNGKSKRK